MVAYLERFHQNWFERLQSEVEKVPSPRLKLLVILDYHLDRQETRAYGGCPFIKANSDAGDSDQRILSEIQQAKVRLKQYITELVADSGHKKILSDNELAETIFLLMEGGIAAASVFKHGIDLEAAKSILKKLI
ncbi:TetR family transcriptional regulator C-terminal domain-containing protein [Flavobacterium sp. 3HN19-14]|uniref:TetR family transcriptional regulator C-terminal domain-containing protein n=1 Tax=Flavobacterium sp. 3HN19-14 TaxID=3448133 RepID=UPI003EDEDA47